jgi:hypothetical protein
VGYRGEVINMGAICIKCNNKLDLVPRGGISDVLSPNKYYCANKDCERFGLVSVLYHHRDDADEPEQESDMPDTPACECGCGSKSQVRWIDLYADIHYDLCQNCALQFVLRNLTPTQFFFLLVKGHTTKEFMLHGDFYDETNGEAQQPYGG